jgi:hypothetical protein
MKIKLGVGAVGAGSSGLDASFLLFLVNHLLILTILIP